MYEVDGICYAGNSADDIRIDSAKPLVGGMMLLTFASGEKRLFDTTELTGSAFASLQDESVFMHPTVQHGFVSWAGGSIDVAPEYMYEHSYPYDEDIPGILVG